MTKKQNEIVNQVNSSIIKARSSFDDAFGGIDIDIAPKALSVKLVQGDSPLKEQGFKNGEFAIDQTNLGKSFEAIIIRGEMFCDTFAGLDSFGKPDGNTYKGTKLWTEVDKESLAPVDPNRGCILFLGTDGLYYSKRAVLGLWLPAQKCFAKMTFATKSKQIALGQIKQSLAKYTETKELQEFVVTLGSEEKQIKGATKTYQTIVLKGTREATADEAAAAFTLLAALEGKELEAEAEVVDD